MSPARPTSLAAMVDAVDRGHAQLDLLVASNGHEPLYQDTIDNLRLLMSAMRNLIDDRATGEFPRLERDRRETPTDPEAARPMNEMPRPIVEYRRRRTRDDEDR